MKSETLSTLKIQEEECFPIYHHDKFQKIHFKKKQLKIQTKIIERLTDITNLFGVESARSFAPIDDELVTAIQDPQNP